MLLKVTVNGQVFHVDAPNKATAKAFGKKQLQVNVEELSLADLQALDVSSVVKVEVEAKPEAAAEGTEGTEGAAAGTEGAAAGTEGAAAEGASGDTTQY